MVFKRGIGKPAVVAAPGFFGGAEKERTWLLHINKTLPRVSRHPWHRAAFLDASLSLGAPRVGQAMKFRQGYLISTGEPKRHYISEAVRHVQMRQGTIGIKARR